MLSHGFLAGARHPWLKSNVILSIDTFCFDKLIFRSDILYSSIANNIDQNGFLDTYEKESQNRSCRTGIRLQTRNDRALDRSLQDSCETVKSNKGKL